MVPDGTILIVDDEPANVRLLERVLARAGYSSVHSTTDPTQVLSLLPGLAPDLILLDLHMPVLDGFGVMSQVAEVVAPDDYLPILVLTADVVAETKQRALISGAKDFVTKPFDTTEVLARVRNLLDTRVLYGQVRELNSSLEDKVAQRTAALWETVGQLEQAHNDLRVAQEETIHSLSLAAEFRDDETSRHIERMSRYCSIIANGLGFDKASGETLRIASKMHDVGKIGVSDSVLLKPGKLTGDEFEVMKTHAQIGYDILSGSSSELARKAAVIAWTHHEWWDGGGYPRGLQHETIPLEGRIAAIADVFDALTTNRVYRKAFEVPEALELMRQERGTHFDPDLLDSFFDEVPQILKAKANFDQMGPSIPLT